jgi:uncharacterized protein YndB with AHSA1/START domain
MVDIANSITINRPVGEVFAYVTDLSNEPAWHTDLLEARKTSDGPVGIGAKYQVRFKPFMGYSEGTEEVIGFEPNRLQVVRGEVGPMRPTVSYLVEPSNGGTRFTRRLQLDASGLMGLLLPLMKVMIVRSNAGFVANLKRVLEREPPTRA